MGGATSQRSTGRSETFRRNERVRRQSAEAARPAPQREGAHGDPRRRHGAVARAGSRDGEHGRGRRTRRCEQGHDLPLVAEQGDARPRCALSRVGHRPSRAARHRLAPSRPARTPSTLDPARPRAPLRARGRGAGRRSPDRSRVRVDLPRAVRHAASRAGPRAPQTRDRSRRAPRISTSISRSTSSTARSTTDSCTATPPSTTASSATSSTLC